MTVKDLKQLLEQCPDNAKVTCDYGFIMLDYIPEDKQLEIHRGYDGDSAFIGNSQIY